MSKAEKHDFELPDTFLKWQLIYRSTLSHQVYRMSFSILLVTHYRKTFV